MVTQQNSWACRNSRLGALLRALLAVGFLVSANAAALAERPILNGAVDDSKRTAVPSSKHRLVASAVDQGAANKNLPMQRLLLVIGADPQTEKKRQQYLNGQHDRHSGLYHRWLTPEEYGDQFGPAVEDVQNVERWLRSQGFSVDGIAKGRRWIEFSGTIGQVEAAFQTQLRRYRIGDKEHVANATDISVPSALTPLVKGVLSLNDFVRLPAARNSYRIERDATGRLAPVEPALTYPTATGDWHYLAPADVAKAYGITPLLEQGLDGQGQRIAIVARSNIDFADVQVFRRTFGLPTNDPQLVPNGADPGWRDDAALEATLDVQWAGAIAPRATVYLVVSASTMTTDGVDLSAAYIVDNNLADVVSLSFQACEQDLGPVGNEFYRALWQQAAAQGISVFVSSGDNGAAGCDNQNAPDNLPAHRGLAVNGLASTPFNTAVGGTQFNENGNDSAFWAVENGQGFGTILGYIPETVWNESCDPTSSADCPEGRFNLFAGSGGASTLYAKPSWQGGPGVPQADRRHLPDVSLAAAAGHDGFLVCYVGSCLTTPDNNILASATVVGGTSASAPVWAGILALINQKMQGRQGLANYVLYPLAAGQEHLNCDSSARQNPGVPTTCVFNDVTSGSNTVPGQPGFSAAAGYDSATGLGSVNALNLANAWDSVSFRPSATSLSVESAAGTHGEAQQVSVTVAPASGAGAPSGDVALLTDKYGAVGIVSLTDGHFAGPVLLPGGQYNLTAHYQGDGIFGSSDSEPYAVDVDPEESTLTLYAYNYNTWGPVPVETLPYGTFVYLGSAVRGVSGSGTPSGTVTYWDGAEKLGESQLNNVGDGEIVSGGFEFPGVLQCLSPGPHAITATYSGDNSFLPSTSASPVDINVIKSRPFVDIKASVPWQIAPGEQLTLRALIGSRGSIVPTGTIQFMDNGDALGQPIPISPGAVRLKAEGVLQTSFAAGTHTINVLYSGDSVYESSDVSPFGSPLVIQVAPYSGTSTQTSLRSSTTSTRSGEPFTLTATVTASVPGAALSGTVLFLDTDSGIEVSTAQLENGTATVTTQWPIGGSRTFVARYSGDSEHAPSISPGVVVDVGKFQPILAITSSLPIVSTGRQVSFTATVSVSDRPITGWMYGISGYVQFFDSVNGAPPRPLGTPAALVPTNIEPGSAGLYGLIAMAGLATVLPDGSHVITAQFSGDNLTYAPATSNPVTVVVGDRGSTAVILSVDSSTPDYGETVTFHATVSSSPSTPAPTGSVKLISPIVGILATAPLQNGSATLVIPWTTGGFLAVSAQYSGDANYSASESAPITMKQPSFAFTGRADQLPIPAGQSAAVYMTVTPLAGFRSTVLLNCGPGLPAGSTCSISPPSVELNERPVTVLFVLDTTGVTGSGARRITLKAGLWSVSGGGAVSCLLLLLLPFRTTAAAKRMLACTLILVSVLAGAVACGGGGGGPTPNPTPPPGQSPTSTLLSSVAQKTAAGSEVVFDVNVTSSGQVPTGTVTLLSGGTPVGQSVTLSNGLASIRVSSLSVGAHQITAQYSGDSRNRPSTSNSLTHVMTGMTRFPVTAVSGPQTRTITMNVLLQ